MMADLPPDPDSTGGGNGAGAGRGSPPGMPRWVKVFGIIGIVVLLLVVIILVTGRGGPGGHGPGRHRPSGDSGDPTPSSSVTESAGLGHKPPAGGHKP